LSPHFEADISEKTGRQRHQDDRIEEGELKLSPRPSRHHVRAVCRDIGNHISAAPKCAEVNLAERTNVTSRGRPQVKGFHSRWQRRHYCCARVDTHADAVRARTDPDRDGMAEQFKVNPMVRRESPQKHRRQQQRQRHSGQHVEQPSTEVLHPLELYRVSVGQLRQIVNFGNGSV
jgi:hypothetical protein